MNFLVTVISLSRTYICCSESTISPLQHETDEAIFILENVDFH